MANIMREIHKNSWLKKDLKKLNKADKFWVVFCVHDDTEAYLEGYVERRQTSSHVPNWSLPLKSVKHVSHALIPIENCNYEFVVSFSDDVARFHAHSWECMLEWVNILRSKLREMKILSPKENIYTKPPEVKPILLATRDPMSPLPATPPVPACIIPGIDLPSATATTSSSAALANLEPDESQNNPTTQVTQINHVTECAGSTTLGNNEYSEEPEPGVSTINTYLNQAAEYELNDMPTLTIPVFTMSTSNTSTQNIINLLSDPLRTYNSNNNNIQSTSINDSNNTFTDDEDDEFASGMTTLKISEASATTSVQVVEPPKKLVNGDLNPFASDIAYVASLKENASLENGHTNITIIPISDDSAQSSTSRDCDKKEKTNISIYQKITSQPVREEFPSDAAAITNIKIEMYEKVFLATSNESNSKSGKSTNHKTTTLLTNNEPPKPSTSGMLRVSPDDILPSTPRNHNFSRGLTEPALIRENGNHSQAKCNGNLVVTNAAVPSTSSKKLPRVLNAGDPSSTNSECSRTINCAHSKTSKSEGNNKLTMREQQVMQLRREISHSGGVRLKLRKKDCINSIAWINAYDRTWVAGWKQKEHPMLYNVLHIGDQLISINGVPVNMASEANKLIRGAAAVFVEVIIHRVPHGKVFAIRRDFENQCLGFIRDGNLATIVDIVPNSLAARASIPPKTQSCDSLSLTFWMLTEINGRPLNLFYKNNEIKERLNSVGLDISVLVQPFDLISKLKKGLKSLRNYKDFILQ